MKSKHNDANLKPEPWKLCFMLYVALHCENILEQSSKQIHKLFEKFWNLYASLEGVNIVPGTMMVIAALE